VCVCVCVSVCVCVRVSVRVCIAGERHMRLDSTGATLITDACHLSVAKSMSMRSCTQARTHGTTYAALPDSFNFAAAAGRSAATVVLAAGRPPLLPLFVDGGAAAAAEASAFTRATSCGGTEPARHVLALLR
jgi:hypothetical protein